MLGNVEVNPSSLQIPISTVALTKNPLLWSKDNVIILTTQLKLFILELECSILRNSVDLQFKRYALDTPEVTNPHMPSGPEYLKCIKNGGTKTMNEQILPQFTTACRRAELSVATEKISKPSQISGDLCHLGYRKTVSSQLNMSKNKGCLFCTVTYDHKLMIVAKVYDSFQVIYDLSAIWNKYIKTKNLLPDETQMYKCRRTLNECIKLQCFYDIFWSPTYKEEAGYYSFVVTITGSGHVVAFKVPGDGHTSGDVSVHKTSLCNFSNVSSTCFHPCLYLEGIMALSNTDGDISMFKVNFNSENLVTYVGKIERLCRAPIAHILLHELIEHTFLFLVARSGILMAYVLKIQDDSVNVLATTYYCGKFNITAIQVMNGYTVYATLTTGAVVRYKFTISPGYDTMQIEAEDLFTSEQVSIDGFAQSPNKSLWAIFETISVPYDHLVIRSASSIQVFGVNKPETLYEFALKDTSVPIQWKGDVIENIRLYVSRGQFNSLLELLVKENIDWNSHVYLQNYIALSRICFNSIAKEDRLNECKDLIILTKDVQIALLDQWILAIKSTTNLSDAEGRDIKAEIDLSPLMDEILEDEPDSKFCMLCRKKLIKSESDFCQLCIKVIDEPMTEQNFMTYCSICHIRYPNALHLKTGTKTCIYCNRALTSIDDIPRLVSTE